MKKVMSIVMALLMFVLMATPAMADDFVKSVGYKDHPELVSFIGPDGNTYYGTIKDADGNVVGYIGEDCIVVTSVADVDESDKIPSEAAALLKKVYNALKDGSMKLPYDKLGKDASKMVIRDLFDVSFLCIEHPEMFAPQGVTVELTFKLGVKANVDVVVMTYKNDQWGGIVKSTNNGDGTVTCVFEDFCPVAFSVPTSSIAGSGSSTGDTANVGLWAGLLAASVVGIGALVVVSRRKKA